jgi:hypothetical protein
LIVLGELQSGRQRLGEALRGEVLREKYLKPLGTQQLEQTFPQKRTLTMILDVRFNILIYNIQVGRLVCALPFAATITAPRGASERAAAGSDMRPGLRDVSVALIIHIRRCIDAYEYCA